MIGRQNVAFFGLKLKIWQMLETAELDWVRNSKLLGQNTSQPRARGTLYSSGRSILPLHSHVHVVCTDLI